MQKTRFAWDIFARHGQFDKVNSRFTDFDTYSALQLIFFDVRERFYTVPKPMYFVQSEVAIMGKTKVRAESVSLKFLRSQGLAGKVVDYKRRDWLISSRTQAGYNNAREAELGEVEY